MLIEVVVVNRMLFSTSLVADRENGDKTKGGAKWDEMNIIATYHPADKDYGHMKIDEPKTPYSYGSDDEKDNTTDEHVHPDDLANRLTDTLEDPSVRQPITASDDGNHQCLQTSEDIEQHSKFEQKRKAHYNEFAKVKMARKLMEQEDDEEETDKPSPTETKDDENAKSADIQPTTQELGDTNE
ncbi:PREDICTED: protein phosphatase inhibitor 2-like isoform X2 [Priapulus caudatus]|uniref:Protein phosphatase inhibitor 2-like isoform X2 n=1 Tax=Priapulus caudatus TaxID=37621 RepID=A0ABM1FA54_PRICU|nr:PREDICTED: protein phosphatase inhibitor 2-like isoform X2 [Priapulus caudatus]